VKNLAPGTLHNALCMGHLFLWVSRPGIPCYIWVIDNMGTHPLIVETQAFGLATSGGLPARLVSPGSPSAGPAQLLEVELSAGPE
jgi:hypothetical protein